MTQPLVDAAAEPRVIAGIDGTESADTLRFWTPGQAQTAGSKTSGVAYRFDKAAGKHVPVTRDDGKLVTFTRESGDKDKRERKKSWRTDLRSACSAAMAAQGVPMFGRDIGLDVLIVAVRKRPSTHLRSGKRAGEVKDWAQPRRPTTRPDALKLGRAVEDALSGVAWADDNQNVTLTVAKVYADQVWLDVDAEGVFVQIGRAGHGQLMVDTARAVASLRKGR